MESSITVNQLPQGISKDSELIISIPTSISKDFNLFSSTSTTDKVELNLLDSWLKYYYFVSSVDECKHTIAEMKSWIINTHGQGVKHPPSFPKSLWWDSCWYNKFPSFLHFHHVSI